VDVGNLSLEELLKSRLKNKKLYNSACYV